MDDQDLNSYIKKVISFPLMQINTLTILTLKLKKSDINRMNTVLYNILNQIRCISILLVQLYPILPIRF